MNRHVTRALGTIAIALALPMGLYAADLSSQPVGTLSFAPRLIVDIKAKSMVGPSIQLDEHNVAHVAWMEEDTNGRAVRYAQTSPSSESLTAAIPVNRPNEAPYWRQEAPALDVRGDMVYIAWAKMPAVPVDDKPFANELRLSRSLDRGQTFLPSAPINDDGEPVLHSFDSIRIDREGAIHVAWIDARGSKNNPGTYVSRSTDHGMTFDTNKKIDDDTCVCCRTAVAIADDGTLYVAWRKVFGEIRETVVARSLDGGLTFSNP
jgi:hypothetical protein